MKLTTIIGVMLAFLASSPPLAAASPAAAIARLEQATVFAFGGVGFAGTTSSGEVAFRELWAERNAKIHFEQVYRHSTPEGRCYALVALSTLDRKGFDRRATAIRKEAPYEVSTMRGCLVSTESIFTLLVKIERGDYAALLSQHE